MTKENSCCIAVVLDASGSMASLTKDTIGSFNTFLQEQKAFPGEAFFTLCTFNDDSHVVHDFVKIADVSKLSEKKYKATGSTALLDAMGSTIDSVGKKLAALPEAERPSKVLMLVITDGGENASSKFSHAQVKSMVEHQQSVYSWEFMFFGASMDQIHDAKALGMYNASGYVPSATGIHDLYRSISNSTTNYRSK